MNAIMARAEFYRHLDTLSVEERKKEIRRVHALLDGNEREKIEHIVAQYRDQEGGDPVLILADVLYDEFGEELGVWERGRKTISEMQRKAYYANGYPAVLFALGPEDARSILARRFTAEQADMALQPAPPGTVKLFVCSLRALSRYHYIAAPD
jgi:hypothetical protein